MDLSDLQLARRRALLTLFAMILGVMMFRQAHGSAVLFFSVACACLGLSLMIRGRIRSALYFGGVLLISGGWVQLRTQQVSITRLDQIVAAHHVHDDTYVRIPIELIGVVVEPVRKIIPEDQPGDPPTWTTARTRTLVHVDQAYLSDADQRGTWMRASGALRILLPDGYLDAPATDHIKPGDRVKLIGMYRGPRSARNIGEPDWAAISAQAGRVGTLVIPDSELIEPLPYDDFFGRVRGSFIKLRTSIQVRAMRALGLKNHENHENNEAVSSQRAMLGALLLGQREPAFGEVYESFKRVGVAHVLAISGFHLALVILIGAFAVRVIGEHPRAELAIVLVVLVLGMLVIPLRPPVVRAGAIVVLMLLAGRSGRRYDRMTVLAWVGVGLLIWRPMDVFSLGYQLSMGISALLVSLADPKPNKKTLRLKIKQMPVRGVISKSKRWVYEAFKMNFACWAVASPTIVYHAGIVSVLAPLVAVVLIPMVMVLMLIGYGQVAVGVASPELGNSTIGVLDWMADGVLAFIGWVDSLPGSSVRVGGRNGLNGTVGLAWVIASTGVIGVLVTRRVRLKSRWMQAAGVVLISWFFIGPMVMRDRAAFRLDMFDVGDGTCVLVQSDGEALLWDCGSLNWRVGAMAGRAAHELGVSNIRNAVVTHDNLDHFNGLINLAPLVGLERVWISRRMIDEPSWAWEQTAHRLREMDIEIVEMNIGTTIQVGNATLTCLWPDREGIHGMDDNDTSIVMSVDVGVNHAPYIRTVLLTGDIESGAIDAVLSQYPELQPDIMEVPHHGSAKNDAMDLVVLLDPELVLQSTGVSRLNDVRWEAVRNERTWYATAERGGVWVRILRNGTIEHGWAVDE